MFSLKRQPRDKPEPIQAHERQAHERFTDAILRNSDQGLFLLGSDGRIMPPLSRELTTLFRRPDVAHLGFERLLAPLVSADTLALVQSHMRRLLGGIWEDGEPANVLKDIEVRLPNTEGPADIAHLWFAFDPLDVPGEPKAWLVRVTDVTLRVRKEREVEDLRNQLRTQGEVLRGVLQMGRGWFGNFVQTTDMSLKTTATLLQKSLREATAGQRKLEQMQGEIERVRSDAADARLAALEQAAAAFATTLRELRQHNASSGGDLLPLTVKMEELQKQFFLVRSVMRSAVTPPAANLDHMLHELTAQVAEREQKQVLLESRGLERVPPRYRPLVRNVGAQLIRNAIAHGIESPAERATAGKAPHGTLRLEFTPQDDCFVLAFTDDGAGLDPAQMRAAAVKRGVLSDALAARMEDREAIKLIFKPNYSPHGAGMSLVRRAVQGCGGTIALASVRGHDTRFKITLPALVGGTAALQTALPEPPPAVLRLASGGAAH